MFVDIFVPYWGDPAWLRETVKSVLGQSSGDWRLTILDDAYPEEWAAHWLKELDEPRIRYVRNENNLGIVNNYRKCIAEAEGELLVLLGCDDVLLPNYVQVLLQAHAEYPTASIIQPEVQVIDEHGLLVRPLADRVKKQWCAPKSLSPVLLAGDSLAAGLLHGNWLYWPSLCFRRSHLVGFDFQDHLKLTHDLAIVLDMVFAGKQLLYVPDVCFSYRRHSKSASNSSLLDGRRFIEERLCFTRAETQAELLGWTQSKRAARWHITSRLNALSSAVTALTHGSPKLLPKLIGHAFMLP